MRTAKQNFFHQGFVEVSCVRNDEAVLVESEVVHAHVLGGGHPVPLPVIAFVLLKSGALVEPKFCAYDVFLLYRRRCCFDCREVMVLPDQ